MITAEDKKFLVNTIWEALQSPKWTKNDLIDFGTAIFSKKKLKDIDESVFNKIFPFLEIITLNVSEKLNQKGEDLLKEMGAEKTETKAESTPAPEEKKEAETKTEEEVSSHHG